MYERFIEELKLYSKMIRVLSKGYLPISLLPPSKLQKILDEVKTAITKSNKDYDLVLTRLYLYYDMKHTCKKIGYEYYCEELFVVKS